MSQEFGIQGLNGDEIIDDILAQLKKRLKGDCSLRPQDSYSRGYSAKITYHIECFGLDKEVVDSEFETGTPQDDPEAEIEEGILEIKQDEDLGTVRDRIEEAEQYTSDAEEEDSLEPSDALAVKTKRKYNRKVKLATGGAEDFQE